MNKNKRNIIKFAVYTSLLLAVVINPFKNPSITKLALLVCGFMYIYLLVRTVFLIAKSNIADTARVLWVIVVLLFPVLGAMLAIYMLGKSSNQRVEPSREGAQSVVPDA